MGRIHEVDYELTKAAMISRPETVPWHRNRSGNRASFCWALHWLDAGFLLSRMFGFEKSRTVVVDESPSQSQINLANAFRFPSIAPLNRGSTYVARQARQNPVHWRVFNRYR